MVPCNRLNNFMLKCLTCPDIAVQQYLVRSHAVAIWFCYANYIGSHDSVLTSKICYMLMQIWILMQTLSDVVLGLLMDAQ